MHKTRTGELIFFWILFAISSFLSFMILSSYMTPMFLAGVLVIMFAPLHSHAVKWCKGNDALASFITVLLVLSVVLVPLVICSLLMVGEVHALYGAYGSGGGALASLERDVDVMNTHVGAYVPFLKMSGGVEKYIAATLGWFTDNLNTFFSGVLSFFFETLLMVAAMYFLYRDGKEIRALMLKWSPLADDHDERIFTAIERAVGSVVKGALFGALIQGVLVGIGFALFGISNPILWGAIAMLAAFVPVVGSAIITVPAGVALFLFGHPVAGIGIIVWGLAFIGLIDNLTRPMVMRRGIDVHPFLLLLSVLGGLVYFGPLGFLAGPIILTFFFTLLKIYPAVIWGRLVNDKK